MKQFQSLRTIFALTMVLVLASCSSEQDIDNPNAASQDSASARFLAVGIQSDMRIDMDIFLQVTSSIGREAYFLDGDPRFTDDVLQDNIDAGGFLITRPWAARYAVVRNCYLLLERADTEVTDPQAAEGYRGFAKMMLAHQLAMNLTLTHDNGVRVDVADVNNLGPFLSRAEAMALINRAT